jgi:hypothetical protein
VLTAVAVTGKDGIYLSKKQCCGSGYGSGKNHSGSGQLRIRNEFEAKRSDKLIKFDNFHFSTKMRNLRI